MYVSIHTCDVYATVGMSVHVVCVWVWILCESVYIVCVLYKGMLCVLRVYTYMSVDSMCECL